MKKILIVDDLKPNRLLLSMMILKNICSKFIIVEAENGEEAVKLCEGDEYELVLMDLRMPIMEGDEAACLIKADKPNQKIIAFSANIDDAYNIGVFDDFLSKPFMFDDMKNMFNKHVKY